MLDESLLRANKKHFELNVDFYIYKGLGNIEHTLRNNALKSMLGKSKKISLVDYFYIILKRDVFKSYRKKVKFCPTNILYTLSSVIFSLKWY